MKPERLVQHSPGYHPGIMVNKKPTRPCKGRAIGEGEVVSQSLGQIYIHVIFSTKDRVRILAYPDLRENLNAYSAGVLNKLDCHAIVVGSVADHMHILFRLSRTASVSDVVGTVKKRSSAWIKEQKRDTKDPYLVKFSWQAGYGAFSVSASKLEAVRTYIENQEEHHHRRGFQEEYRLFLKRHGVAFDERYVWD